MFKLIKRLSAVEWLMMGVSTGFICLGVWMDLRTPEYLKDILELLQKEGTKVSEIMGPGSKMLAYSIGSFICAVIVGFIAARTAASFITRLRSDIFHQVMDYSDKEIKNFSIPSLLTRTTNDLAQLQILIVIGMQVVLRGPIMAVWAITKIWDKSSEWTGSLAVTVGIVIFMFLILIFVAFPKQRKVQGYTDDINSITRESLSGIRVIRAYNAEQYELDRFDERNNGLTKLNLFVFRMMTMMNPIMTTVSGVLTLVIYWFGASLINDVTISPTAPQVAFTNRGTLFADMTIFSQYGMQVIIGFMMMVTLLIILPRALVSAKRVNEVLSFDSSVHFTDKTQQTPQSKGEIEFRDVTFAYSKDAQPVISHVSFKAEAGQTVAFIGSTGSGKSTLVNLIPRFYDATGGQILIDGVDIKDYAHKDLNDKIGYIAQKAVLFSGTIRSNMTFGESTQTPLTEEAIWEALELAQARDFVEGKEDGLDAEVAQGGTNFSGGQKQRLSIARALVRKPEILIFDDSFSALDYKTDRILRKGLSEKLAHTTRLIVAQRISTIMDADQIIVLDEGRVVGQGTHKELLSTNKTYQEIAYSQLSKEDLDREN